MIKQSPKLLSAGFVSFSTFDTHLTAFHAQQSLVIMRTTRSALATAIFLSLASSAVSQPPILVYSATAGYRHDSIPTAITALQSIADRTSLYSPTFSEDQNLFTTDRLAQFKAIVFLSNSDQVLTSDGETAFAEWLTKGGSLVGLHAATGLFHLFLLPLLHPPTKLKWCLYGTTACLFNDVAFGTAMGSWFNRHPTSEPTSLLVLSALVFPRADFVALNRKQSRTLCVFADYCSLCISDTRADNVSPRRSQTFTKLIEHETIDMLPDRYK